jgi:hypothetical protein
LSRRSFSNPIKKKYSGTVAVLANGPSLKEVVPHLIVDDEFKDVDFIVMNFFAFDDAFFKIKPKHYCLADPIFFQESHRIDEVRKLFALLQNNVDWELTIYVPKTQYRQFIRFSGMTNKKVSIVGLNCVPYTGFESLRNVFYKKGLAMPRLQTVANMAIYIAINCNYPEIKLYGVDHNFFDSWCVNDQNQLCSKYTHFNDATEHIKPFLDCDGSVIKISKYLKLLSYMFKSHDLLADYAKYLKVNILNCTEGSMIDSYERVKKYVT